MITAKGISKAFGDKTVFSRADISVADGSICGLVGINGAGKSTLLRILAGVITADEGVAEMDGEPVFENKKIKSRLFFLSDDPYYDYNITGERLKKFYSALYDFDGALFDDYIKKFGLDVKKPIRNFSKGMKRQMFISAALACKPQYLLLDEAFDGLDPLARLEFKRGLIELQGSGATVIIASHSLRELEDICDSFILIDRNTVKVCGRIEDALDDIFKLQLVFEGDVTERDLPFECVRFDKLGRVITVVAHGDKDELVAKLDALKPLVVDEIPMDFEDYFIEEVSRRDGK